MRFDLQELAALSLGASCMAVRQILAANLRRPMAQSSQATTVAAVERVTRTRGCKVGKSTVQRALQAESPINLDYLAALAKAFGLQPWQLLVPDLDPNRLPALTASDPAREAVVAKLIGLARDLAPVDTGAPSTVHEPQPPWKKPRS